MSNENDRRAYWTRQLDDAYEFMLSIQAWPVEECGEPVASLAEAIERARVRVELSRLPHVKGLSRLHYLRVGLIDDFIAAAREMNDRGWMLKIEDAYRTREIQKHNALRPEVFPLVLERTRWELGGKEPPLDLIRRRLAALVAMNPKTGTHCSGSAIDVSVLTMDGTEVDRGAPYLEISEKTPMGSPFIAESARRNRQEITAIMARHGFRTYHFEFWHYNKGDAYDEFLGGTGKPARYGPVDLDPATGAVTPIADPLLPLNSEEEIERLIRASLHGNAR
jgi:zinc D-Ala-D-Ala dipeptidase